MNVRLVSAARLGTFQALTKGDAKALELHNQTLLVGSSLMSMIALIELSLRNLIDQQISSDFAQPDWLINPNPSVQLHDQERKAIALATQHARKANYSKLSQAEKRAIDSKIYPHGIPPNIKHETLSRKRWEALPVTQGQVVAQTTIFLWKRLFSSDYEKTLWKRSLRKLFPNKTIARSDVSVHLEALYAARNRVAHHEPVYGQRLEEAFHAVIYLRENLTKKASDVTTDFQVLTEIQFHRLYIDYVSFNKNWSLLTM